MALRTNERVLQNISYTATNVSMATTLTQLLKLSILVCVAMTLVNADPGEMHDDTSTVDDAAV